jgi:hypothetical protein
MQSSLVAVLSFNSQRLISTVTLLALSAHLAILGSSRATVAGFYIHSALRYPWLSDLYQCSCYSNPPS